MQKKAFFDLVVHSTAKAKEVNVVERAVADAIGIGLDIQNSPGIFIANFGGETTELSVLASGGMVLNKLVKTGGAMLDNAISSLVRHTTDFFDRTTDCGKNYGSILMSSMKRRTLPWRLPAGI